VTRIPVVTAPARFTIPLRALLSPRRDGLWIANAGLWIANAGRRWNIDRDDPR